MFVVIFPTCYIFENVIRVSHILWIQKLLTGRVNRRSNGSKMCSPAGNALTGSRGRIAGRSVDAMAFSPIKSNADLGGGGGACVPHNSVLSMKRLKEDARSPSGKRRKEKFVPGSDCGEISPFPLSLLSGIILALCTTPLELTRLVRFLRTEKGRRMSWKLD